MTDSRPGPFDLIVTCCGVERPPASAPDAFPAGGAVRRAGRSAASAGTSVKGWLPRISER